MAVFDGPPQTVREAIDMGWMAMSFECPKCFHKGFITFYKLEERGRGHWFLATVALRAACRKCNCRPREISLVAPLGLGSHDGQEEKAITIFEGRVLRPAGKAVPAVAPARKDRK